MAEGIRDVRLGRLGLATIYDDMQEGVGDTLAVTGAGVALGERKPKKYSFNLAVHGTQGDDDPYSVGMRMRRQARALMENSRLRSEGLYFMLTADPEQNGWVLLGGGQLVYTEGGVSLAQFQLTLDDAYRVGSLRTHRPARRVELYDRRLGTTPRDWLGQVFGTDYAAVTAQAITYLPEGVTDVIGAQKAPVAYGTRASLGGAVPVVVGRTHGEVLNFEWAEANMGSFDDVVVWERAGHADPPGGYAATTLAYRPRLYLRLDDAVAAPAAADISDYLNNGVYVGSPLYQAPSLLVGDNDASVGLDQAIGVYVRVPDASSLDIVGDLTLRIRAQPRSGATGIQGLIGKASSVLAVPAQPTATPSTTGGTLATATYGYRITALNPAAGETTPGVERTVAVTGPTGSVVLAWAAVPNASQYRVYGRTAAGELLLATVTTPTYTDTGAATPAGAMPGANTTGPYGWRFGWDPATGEMVFGASSNGTTETQATSIGAAITPGQAVELGVVYAAAAGSAKFYRNGVLLNTVTGLPTALFANNKQVTVSKWESDS